ncbi:MAG: thioredoxin domain-containing protein [Actinobacteria bacterium]|nr:thioredoxin domain-containing protein [Actinomycetota bacterium]
MTNRLREATSPYLLQHADNPVDWQPWDEAALAEARERDLPILLSIGYAACHWCHVMAHESFEDAAVAAALRGRFVAIKVDREERPDLDAVYMAATVALTGRGGWPMTVLLTPQGRPFWAGTYLPRDQFLGLLDAAWQAWQTQRAEIEASAVHIAQALGSAAAGSPGPGGSGAGGSGTGGIDERLLEQAVEGVKTSYDAARGGFGGAPKFPPSMVLEWLLAHHGRTGSDAALAMVEGTCEGMARGGMYDQLAGGFARYSTDANWVVPHFEKMLYDNALLLRVYTGWFHATGSRLAERIARETADFLIRDLGTAEGAFASALDADAAGVEGLTYAWTPAQLVEVLGDADGARAAALLSVTETGTFEHGASTLQLRREPDPGEEIEWWGTTRERLLAARADRPQPARDDKVVTAWNGLAIAALAECGATLGSVPYVEAARTAAAYLLGTHLVDGRLRRTSRTGVVGESAGVASDYGTLAAGLVALAQATREARWLTAAGELLATAMARFGADDGGFYDTPDDGEALIVRPREEGDNAEPCGTSSLAGALLAYGALTGSPAHLDRARTALTSMSTVAASSPRFAGRALAVAEAFVAGPLEVAIVAADPRAPDAFDLLAAARRSLSPGLVLAVGRPDEPGWPLLADRPLVGGVPTAYVCRGFSCDAPVTDPAELADRLRG